jgi:opacity protein-like surface antigen
MRYEKIGLLFVLVFSFVIVAPSLALAELSLNLGLGAAITQDEDVTVRANGLQVTDEVDWDASISGFARLGWWPSAVPYLGLAADASYFAPEEQEAETDIFVMSALVMFRYPEGQFHPYIGAGPGLFYSKFDVNLTDFGLEDFSDESLDVGLDARAGLQIDVKENFGIFAEYRFTYFEPEYDDSISGVNVEIEPEFYTHHLLAGLIFFF